MKWNHSHAHQDVRGNELLDLLAIHWRRLRANCRTEVNTIVAEQYSSLFTVVFVHPFSRSNSLLSSLEVKEMKDHGTSDMQTLKGGRSFTKLKSVAMQWRCRAVHALAFILCCTSLLFGVMCQLWYILCSLRYSWWHCIVYNVYVRFCMYFH